MSCLTVPSAGTVLDLGAAPLLSADFADKDGVPINPTAVEVKVRPPNGTTITYTAISSPPVTNPSVGHYELLLPVTTLAGDWWYRFVASGTLVDAAEALFTIRGSAFTTVAPPAAGRWISAESLRTEPELVDVKLPPPLTFDDVVVAATDLMFSWTGRRYGQRSSTIRPNRGTWGCDCLPTACGCCGEAQVILNGPVLEESLVVVVDGVTLPSSAYALFDKRMLYRIDGRTWPCCQDLSAPFGTPGTWSVSYTWGPAPKKILELATRQLAIHIALRLSGKPSKLPSNAVAVTGRGVSLSLARRHDSLGRRVGPRVFTGIALVDDAIATENPNGLMRRATVASPDTIRRTRT